MVSLLGTSRWRIYRTFRNLVWERPIEYLWSTPPPKLVTRFLHKYILKLVSSAERDLTCAWSKKNNWSFFWQNSHLGKSCLVNGARKGLTFVILQKKRTFAYYCVHSVRFVRVCTQTLMRKFDQILKFVCTVYFLLKSMLMLLGTTIPTWIVRYCIWTHLQFWNQK